MRADRPRAAHNRGAERTRAHVRRMVRRLGSTRNHGVARSSLCDRSKIAASWARYALLTPLYGRRKFLSPVQIPSGVFQCTSRPRPRRRPAPAPAARVRPSRARTHPTAAARTPPTRPCRPPPRAGPPRTAETGSASPERGATRRRIRPLTRPTAPGTGGRSTSHGPRPRHLIGAPPRRVTRAGVRPPLFSRVLVQLVGLDLAIRQRRGVAMGQGDVPEPVPDRQQVGAADPRHAGLSRRGGAPGDAAEDQDRPRGGGTASCGRGGG